jgi:hypothetical protein
MGGIEGQRPYLRREASPNDRSQGGMAPGDDRSRSSESHSGDTGKESFAEINRLLDELFSPRQTPSHDPHTEGKRTFEEAQDRYERSEVHYGGMPTEEVRLRNGKPIDIAHLYTGHRQDGQSYWWTERQSHKSWLNEVRDAHKRGDQKYERIPEDAIPSTITHTSSTVYRSEGAPIYNYQDWIHIHYTTYSNDGPGRPTISILNSPDAESDGRTEPNWKGRREQEEQPVFDAGRMGGDHHGWKQKDHTGSGYRDTSREETEPDAPRRKKVETGRVVRITEEQDEPKAVPGKIDEENVEERSGSQNGEQGRRREDNTRRNRGEEGRRLPPELQKLADQLRAQLKAEQEEYSEGFNGAEYVRQQLENELAGSEGERNEYYQSLLNSFDAVAYGRYISDDVREDALSGVAESQVMHGSYVDETVGVTPHVAASLKVLTGALDINYRHYEWYVSGSPDHFSGEGVGVSSEVVNDLIEKSGGKLRRAQRLKPSNARVRLGRKESMRVEEQQ